MANVTRGVWAIEARNVMADYKAVLTKLHQNRIHSLW